MQLSEEPIPYPFYSASSVRGKALTSEVLSLVKKGAVELTPLPSPGFYNRLFGGDEGLRILVTSYRPFSSLSVVGNRRQLGEVSSGVCAADDISWRPSGFAIFQGFA